MYPKPSTLVIFQEAGQPVEVRLDTRRETVWLTQRQMADVFDTSTDNISLHLKNIFADGELSEEATTEDSSVVRHEGKRQVTRKVTHYNLDAIISVGYRVSSKRAVQFRQWATRILREHLTQGYTLNRQRKVRNLAVGNGTYPVYTGQIMFFKHKPKTVASTPFSEFIRNASSAEKKRVYKRVLEMASESQNRVLARIASAK